VRTGPNCIGHRVRGPLGEDQDLSGNPPPPPREPPPPPRRRPGAIPVLVYLTGSWGILVAVFLVGITNAHAPPPGGGGGVTFDADGHSGPTRWEERGGGRCPGVP